MIAILSFQWMQHSAAVNIGKLCCHFQKNEISVISKYGFCNKRFRKDKTPTSWILFSIYLSSSKIRSSSNQNIGEGESNFDDKYVETVSEIQGPRKRVGALAHPVFGKSVNPISTRGDTLSPSSTTSPLRFSDIATALRFIFPKWLVTKSIL